MSDEWKKSRAAVAVPITDHSSPITEFPHVRRMRDERCPLEIASILPGEYFVSREPMIVYTVLGSCVSACVRDPLLGVGGMNHFMLPAPKGDGRSDSWGESARYGSYAMEMLINEILKRGGRKDRLEVKVFGAGRIYEGGLDVGAGNAAWMLAFLEREGFQPITTDLGGNWPRKVYYFTESGRVLLKRIEKIKNRTIFEREEAYRDTLARRQRDGEVTLF
jgi:chemotaxis protein CheD